MTDSLAVGPDAQVNALLSQLRTASDLEGEIGSGTTDLKAGIKLHPDPALQMAGHWSSPEGRIVELRTEPSQQGDWFGLHVPLAAGDLSRHGMIGFACRAAADELLLSRVCIRSGTEVGGGYQDFFFDKHLITELDPGLHLDATLIHGQRDLPVWAPWREMVLFLPTAPMTMSIVDLRVFIL